MIKKYIVHPGYIKSKNDGEIHYVSPYKLIALYGVKINECLLSTEIYEDIDEDGYMHLFPRDDGNYTVRCDHCGKEYPIVECVPTTWNEYKLTWYYCNNCIKLFEQE